MSDIDIGQITEALNDKTDRDMRNVDNTAGADAVIEYQVPTAGNDYTWYRKYKSGWVEQGGYKYQGSSVQGNNTINLPVTMADTNYTVLVTQQFTAAGQGYVPNEVYPSRTTASFVLGIASAVYGYNWEVKGMAA